VGYVDMFEVSVFVTFVTQKPLRAEVGLCLNL
jgi:hypothetical protein